MFLRKLFVRSTAFVVVSLMAFSAVADDIVPPPYRGAPRSIVAEWEFLDDLDPIAPDGPLGYSFVVGPDGVGPVTGPNEPVPPQPWADMNLGGNMGWNLDDGFGGQGQWFAIGDDLSLIKMPNFVDEEPIKFIRLQTTFTAPIQPGTNLPNAQPRITEILGFDPTVPAPVPGMPMSMNPPELLTADPTTNIGLFHLVEDWKILPNPDYEQLVIHIPQGVGINQWVIDTVSIPEPTTFALAAFCCVGGVLLVRRRRAS